MPLYEVFLKVKHDCPTSIISREFPNVRMVEWCNREHDVVEMVLEGSEQRPLILERFAEYSSILQEVSDGHKVQLITRPCDLGTYESVSSHFGELNMLDMAPVLYEAGWEYHRLIVFEHKGIRELLDRLREKDVEAEIIKKTSFKGSITGSTTLTVDALFSDLTEKQIDALLTAYSHGYFRIPRRSDVKTIAAKNKVPRTTFSEHLNKAENKLVRSLVPHIQLFRQSLSGA